MSENNQPAAPPRRSDTAPLKLTLEGLPNTGKTFLLSICERALKQAGFTGVHLASTPEFTGPLSQFSEPWMMQDVRELHPEMFERPVLLYEKHAKTSSPGGSFEDPLAYVTEAWPTIDSAPKDGKEVLVRVKMRAGMSGRCLVGHYMVGGHCIEDHPAIAEGWYFWNGCMFDKAAEPTHWHPPSTRALRGE